MGRIRFQLVIMRLQLRLLMRKLRASLPGSLKKKREYTEYPLFTLDYGRNLTPNDPYLTVEGMLKLAKTFRFNQEFILETDVPEDVWWKPE